MLSKLKIKNIHLRYFRYKKNSEFKKALFFLAPSLLGISIFVLIPFVDVIRRSFFDAMNKKYVGLSNYYSILGNEAFIKAVKNTVRFLGTCIPLLLVLTLLLSLLLYKQKKHKEFLKISFLLPMSIPVASVVVLWKLLFHENGLINVLLHHFHISNINFINSGKAFYILVFTYIWKNAGYDMILWLTGLYGIDESYYEAASVDGAGRVAKFYYITLPNLLPTIFMIGVLSFINSFKVFREAYLIAGDYPNNSIYMLQHILNNWFVSLDIQKMSAAAVLTMLVFLILILLFKLLDKTQEE
ncbi:carbohydrate ABC transporter permease [Anaeromicropila herbilytica]|uniref:Sugar ABC transporter permease n=1 Tax=Anaeromicropila herbilytica TaxID=2785025 RepID=A0A7R7EJ01_9FIRM|nr:sugar ABC transporter permease [Anaeromicropila herbilytica]BCN29726.1 sugar ABC transporter permease [Anaeromicropila herbilytica]